MRENSNIRKACVGFKPENSIEAAIKILPSGFRPTNGWLFQQRVCPFSQTASTMTIEPKVFVFTVHGSKQLKQKWKSCRRALSKTMNFFSFLAVLESKLNCRTLNYNCQFKLVNFIASKHCLTPLCHIRVILRACNLYQAD